MPAGGMLIFMPGAKNTLMLGHWLAASSAAVDTQNFVRIAENESPACTS